MATNTPNYHLIKPAGEDFYNIQDFNDNADILDAELSKKAVKAASPIAGNLAALTAAGDLLDSGKKTSDFAEAVHSHANATTTGGGFMSKADKVKLDGVAAEANNYTHPATHPASMVTGLASVATSGNYSDILDRPAVYKATGFGAVIMGYSGNRASEEYAIASGYYTRAGHGGAFVTGGQNAAMSRYNFVGCQLNTTGQYLTGYMPLGNQEVTTNPTMYIQNPPSSFGESSFAVGDILPFRTSFGNKDSVTIGYLTVTEFYYDNAVGQWKVVGTSSKNINTPGSIYLFYKSSGCVSTMANGQSNAGTGDVSHAEGWGTWAKGVATHSDGVGTITSTQWAQYAMGEYNIETADAYFVIGKGTGPDARSNAFRVSRTGKVYGSGDFNTTGADYAEYFEWTDGNPDGEDRRGLFVTLDGEKIRLATADDDYILGVVSSTPAYVGDSYGDQWQGMYLKDRWGNTVMEMQEVPESTIDIPHQEELDEDGNIIREAYTEKVVVAEAHEELLPVINPDYDPSQPYTPRDQRPEWAPVGMLGKLVVIDDGSCQVNGYCRVSQNGQAEAAQTGYRVMERIDGNHIRILLK